MADGKTAILRARGWMMDVFAHHHAEALRTQRAVVRKAQGVPMDDLPYPGSSVITTTSTTTAAVPPLQEPSGWLGKVLLASAIGLGAGVLGGLGLKALLAPPSVPVPTPPAAEPFNPDKWQLKIVP